MAIAIASHLAGNQKLELGITYGDFKSGTAVRAIQVPGTNHVTIVFSVQAAREIIQWCFQAFGMAAPAKLELDDPMPRVYLIASIAFIVLLFPIGHAVGILVPPRERRPAGVDAWLGLLGFTAALILTMPLVSIDYAVSFLSLDVGAVIVSWFALTGVVILGVLAILARPDGLGRLRLSERPAATYLSALLGFVVIYAMQIPGGAVFHRMTPTPERLIAALIATLALIPFFLGFETLVRRGGMVTSTVMGVLGRAVTLVLLGAGVAVGVIPFVVVLILPSLAIQFIMFEIFAGSVYASSGNIFPVALLRVGVARTDHRVDDANHNHAVIASLQSQHERFSVEVPRLPIHIPLLRSRREHFFPCRRNIAVPTLKY